MRATGPKPCLICQTGQRLSTLAFAVFAIGLFVASNDPEETPIRQSLMMLCAALSGLAVFRFPIARLATWHYARRRHRNGPQLHVRNQLP